MKEKRTVRAIQSVREALENLGDEFAFAEAKTYLHNALSSLQKIDIKNKSIIHNYAESFKNKAMQNSAQWHQALLDGVAKLSHSDSGATQVSNNPAQSAGGGVDALN